MKKATENFKQFIFTHTWGTDLGIDITMYLDLSKKIIDQEAHSASVCSDPMNGCPGDFAEDYSREIRKLEREFESWPFKIPAFILAILDYQIHRHYKRAWESYNNLPWNQDYQDENLENDYSEMPY